MPRIGKFIREADCSCQRLEGGVNEDLGFLVGMMKCSGTDSGHMQPCDGAKTMELYTFQG